MPEIELGEIEHSTDFIIKTTWTCKRCNKKVRFDIDKSNDFKLNYVICCDIRYRIEDHTKYIEAEDVRVYIDGIMP